MAYGPQRYYKYLYILDDEFNINNYKEMFFDFGMFTEPIFNFTNRIYVYWTSLLLLPATKALYLTPKTQLLHG